MPDLPIPDPSGPGVTAAVVAINHDGGVPRRLIEAAVFDLDARGIAAADTWLVRPPGPVAHWAAMRHGITTADVAGRPALAEVLPSLAAALDRPVLITHRSTAVIDVLTRELPGWPSPDVQIMSTRELARQLRPGWNNYALASLAAIYGLDRGLPEAAVPGRAAYEALLTARLFLYLATDANGVARPLGELVALATRGC